MTRYIVLMAEHPNPEHWKPLREVNARSASAAIKTHVNGADDIQRDGGGLFVAVPARSWKPVTVKIETKTELRFS